MAYSMPLWTILEKWPAPTRPACTKPDSPVRTQRVEGGLHLGDVVGIAAGHQGIAVLEAPDAAADAAVDEADALSAELGRVLLVVGPARVAAVDDDVARRPAARRARRSSPGGSPAGTITHTTLGDGSLLDQLLQGADVARASGSRS